MQIACTLPEEFSMDHTISTRPPTLSPFRFDSTPQGEADVDPDQIAVRDGNSANDSGWGYDGFGFGDILDIVNPMHHIPVVSTIYRQLTGDEIAPAPRALGGAIFGGPVGLVAAIGNQIFEAETGSDIGTATLAMMSGSGRAGETAKPDGGGETSASQVAFSSTRPDQAAPRTSPIVAVTQAPLPGSVNPMEVSNRAGLFSKKDRPVQAAINQNQTAPTESQGSKKPLQAASANALDRLIARSKSAATASTAGDSPQIPTDPANVHQWMLRALGKYETMPKG
jgi:hypothetical protein